MGSGAVGVSPWRTAGWNLGLPGQSIGPLQVGTCMGVTGEIWPTEQWWPGLSEHPLLPHKISDVYDTTVKAQFLDSDLLFNSSSAIYWLCTLRKLLSASVFSPVKGSYQQSQPQTPEAVTLIWLYSLEQWFICNVWCVCNMYSVYVIHNVWGVCVTCNVCCVYIWCVCDMYAMCVWYVMYGVYVMHMYAVSVICMLCVWYVNMW